MFRWLTFEGFKVVSNPPFFLHLESSSGDSAIHSVQWLLVLLGKHARLQRVIELHLSLCATLCCTLTGSLKTA